MTEWEIPEERGVGPDSKTFPRSTHDSSSVQNHWRVLIAQEQPFPLQSGIELLKRASLGSDPGFPFAV